MLKQVVFCLMVGFSFLNTSAMATEEEFKNSKLSQLKLEFIEIIEAQSFGNCGDVKSMELIGNPSSFFEAQIVSDDLNIESSVQYTDSTQALTAFFALSAENVQAQAPRVLAIAKTLENDSIFFSANISGAMNYTGAVFAAIDIKNNQALLVRVGLCEF